MALTREKKQKIIEDLENKIKKQKIMVFVDFTGLKVKDFSDLRKKIKKTEGEIKVVKKTLLKVVFKKIKKEIDPKKMVGELALVFGYNDIILPVKTVCQFSEAHPNLKILGGFFEEKFLTDQEVIDLSQLPSKEELVGRLIFTARNPVYMIYYILQNNLNILRIKT